MSGWSVPPQQDTKYTSFQAQELPLNPSSACLHQESLTVRRLSHKESEILVRKKKTRKGRKPSPWRAYALSGTETFPYYSMVCQGNSMKSTLTGSVVPLILFSLVCFHFWYGTTYLFFPFYTWHLKITGFIDTYKKSFVDWFSSQDNSTLSHRLREKRDTQTFALFKCYFIKYLQFKVSL